MTRTLPPIELDEFFPHPPVVVWRALTDSRLMASWLMENDFEPVVGHTFQMKGIPVPAVGFTGQVASEVLQVEENHLLSISWRDAGSGNALSSTVTWRLEPEGDGTRLFLTHDGFDPADPTQVIAHRIMSGGWRSRVIPRLTEVVLAAA